jgi:hypothetical protein
MPGEPTLLRVLITGRHWQKFETFEAQFSRAAAKLAAEEGEPGLKNMAVSRRQFERWCAGKVKTLPYPGACRVLERMFGYPVNQLLGSASQQTSQISQVPQRPDAALITPAEKERYRPAREVEGTPLRVIAPAPAWALREEAHDQYGSWASAGSALPDTERIVNMATRRALQFSASADNSNVGGQSLEMLRGEVGRLAVAYPQQPLPTIIGDIVTLQDMIFSLLEGRQRPRETRDLYVIGGLVSGMLAKAAHDLRDPHTAMTHARTGLLCAENAEHSALAAWVRGLESLIAYWADRPREALEYARAGADVPGVRGSTSVWLASLEARAWSVLGDATESQRAIERAADLRESTVRDDLDELGGMCNFSRPRQLYYAADASASLPAHYSGTAVLLERAEQYATDAIGAYASAPEDEKSFGDEAGSRTDLAISRIRSDDLDGAQEALEPVIGLPVSQRIHGVVSSVVNVHRAIATKSLDAPIARTMQEAIEEYCRTPAAALPR